MIIKNGTFGYQRNMNQANERLEKAMGKLSSGKRITSAAVDASGLAISEKLRALQRGPQQALRNVQDAQSLVQTADAAMQELTDVVQRIRELTIQSMNGTNTDVQPDPDSADTLIIQNEIDELKRNLRDIVHNTEFNTHKVLTNTVPGEYVYADRNVSVDRSASTVTSSANAVTGGNTVSTEPTVYTRHEPVSSLSQNVNETFLSYPPDSVKMTTVMDHKPQWSTDGNTIVFQSTRDGKLYSVAADGSSDPVEADPQQATAASRKVAGDYRLEVVNSQLQLQKRTAGNWAMERTYGNFNLSDGLQGYNFAPGVDQQGNLSFAFSDTDGNISKVVINTQNGSVSSPVTIIPNTDKLNLPPLRNTITLESTPDLYRMNEADASLVVHKVTDSGPQKLTYWDGAGEEPETGYYTVNGNQITFHKGAIIGFDPDSEDDAQDYYTIEHVTGNGSAFHSETIPSQAQLYNVHGEPGPMSLRITVGGSTVAKEQFLSERPADPESTTGVYIDKTNGRVEFYGELRPAYNQTVTINYVPDSDADRSVQTHVLPSEIDTYNLNSNDPSLPKSLKIYVGGKEIGYDASKTDGYTYDHLTRRISIYGNSRPDVSKGESIRYEFIEDPSSTSKEVYGIPLGATKPEVFNLGDASAPNSIRVFRGNEEINYSATDGFQYNAITNTIELFGNSRPNVGDNYSVRFVAVPADPVKHDDKLEIPLAGTPELYNADSPGFPSTLKVTIGGRTIAYDETKQNGYFYNRDTNTIEVYGNSRPDANDFTLTSPSISVTYATETGSVNLYNNSYDIRLAADASSYGIEDDGHVKGLKVFKNMQEIPLSAENGYTYNAETKLVSLHGSYRPSANDAANSIRIYSVPESALTRTVPAGSTVHKVFVDGTEILPAEDEHGDGYVIEEGAVRLVGNARPDTVFGKISYKMEVLYTEPLSMELPINPLLTDDNSYCDHETGTALPDSEIVPDSQVIRLNGEILSRDQYKISGNRVTLINDKVNLTAGSHTLSADYQIRQGIQYADNSYTFQVGGNAGNQQVLKIASFDNMLEDMSAICVRTAEHAGKGLEIIDRSMNFILGELGNIGAAENSLEHISANLRVGEESLTAALSRIEDVDMAKELMNSTKQQMLLQVGQTLAGHEKQRAGSVLELLR
ncbi:MULTISPECIES: flagellin [unclassified Sporosarcina]|uniref:flagellin N-terminal helical domain-containing protein n=1 Tax=unclassified Sporosarcina TaxID=2647733 RepID=UPI00203B366D|nr:MULTISPECIES: flagellin [unclassified Sporosarcina]GKV64838.1 hypothetical protein NCCP2331_09910 [Sporosarcina sp. NCCP-2331]GLB54948.1 hypothetical protein NCCP2378_07330 [Sporosarcina sp. NCCP-2378]